MRKECNAGYAGPLIWVPYENVTERIHQHEINEHLTYQHYSTGANHSQILKELFWPGSWNSYE